jgi:methylated-DNA-[protein]-cysteine S-methyltransferase
MNTNCAFVCAQRTPTPGAVFTTIATTDGTVIASGFTDDVDHLMSLIGAPLRPQSLERRASLESICDAVDAYFAGSIDAIDPVRVVQSSTALRERGWEELRRITPGEPISYGELAKRIDVPRGARAAGQVCARNAASLFVPCHRVVAAGGSAHHFGWGLPTKNWLLTHEATHSGRRVTLV